MSMIDTKDIIVQAEKFYETAKDCIGIEYNNGWYVGDKELSTEELKKYLFPKNVVTATVNLAFCCELLLKSMLNNGAKIKGHKLRPLFSTLDEKWKQLIILKMGYENSNQIFYHLLDEISNSFEKWRYIYECKLEDRKIQFSFLNNFSIILMCVAHAKYFYEKKEFDKIDSKDLELILK